MQLRLSLLALTVLAAGACSQPPPQQTPAPAVASTPAMSAPRAQATQQHSKAADSSHSHSHSHSSRVPAYLTADSKLLKELEPTLAPEKFFGKTRLAYQAVREIPKTIAQLPCYCHCDEGFGHKSLYSCFVDDHASHCAVCVDEALLAHQLQKKDKLTPAQIRERIIKQYSEQH